MSEQPIPPAAPQAGAGKSSRTWLIVVIVLVAVCCVCAALGGTVYYLYQNGDRIFHLTPALAPYVPA